MTETDRIERLETVVRSLNQQVAELRGEIAALRGGRSPDEPRAHGAPLLPGLVQPEPEPAGAPAAPTARPARPARGVAAVDLEEVVGRYGTLALATLALLAGMGAFLTWAIAHGMLGPAQRVVLGAIGAAIVATAGWRLRARGTVRFGNTLLALALALLHLDLWAAGPRLHVVPPVLALVVTAVASVALAALALRTVDEPLYCVGLGGALAAPFVASTGGGSAGMLAGYGWVVIARGLAAISTLSWRIAIVIIAAGCTVYATAAQQLLQVGAPWMERAIPTVFALACSWAALAWAMRELRCRLAVSFLIVAVAALLAARLGPGRDAAAIVLGLAGTVTAVAALQLGSASPWWKVVAAVLVPLAFLGATLEDLAYATSARGAAVAALWVGIALAAAWRDAENRDLHFSGAAATSAAAVLLALNHAPELCVVALAVHVSLFSTLLRQRRAPAIAVPIAIVLVIVSFWASSLLAARIPYAYPPFVTAESASALATVLAWCVFSRIALSLPAMDLPVLAVAPPLSAFVWARQELIGAFSRDISVFLLVVFYALAGIGAIFYGRRRSLAPARAAGLALACYAAVKALVHAWSLSAIGLRVGACILAGAFIALVAYWYRAGRGEEGESRKRTADSRELPRGRGL